MQFIKTIKKKSRMQKITHVLAAAKMQSKPPFSHQQPFLKTIFSIYNNKILKQISTRVKN